jgi:hypothetical protein
MAEPNEIADGEKTVAPESKSELPNVESPPLSPAEKLSEPVLEAQMKPQAPQSAPAAAPTVEPVTPEASSPHFTFPKLALPHVSRRNRRRAALAATVLIAAGFGAAVGAIASRAPAPQPPKRDAALLEENHALQRSVAKLNKDIGALKANIEANVRETKTQIAKTADRLNDRIERAVETTGSIGKPAAATPPKPAEKADAAPLPTPRPTIVQGWSVHEAMNGRAFVEHRGEFFRVAPGVPLPGLGKVESIRREGDQLVVVTTKGLITANQASASIRPRPPYYGPYWRPY